MNVYTDGACRGNPGPGGWGVYIKDLHTELNGSDVNTTNNKMELMAVIQALEYLKNENIQTKIILHTDSQYVKNGIQTWIYSWIKNGWKTANKKPVKNVELWKTLYAISQQSEIEWKWVKGHSGDFGNDKADELANRF